MILIRGAYFNIEKYDLKFIRKFISYRWVLSIKIKWFKDIDIKIFIKRKENLSYFILGYNNKKIL